MRAGGRIGALTAGALLAVAAGCTTTVTGDATPADGGGSEGLSASVAVSAYSAGQEHVTTEVDYAEEPPVGGPHDGEWADCTGTVYDVDIRHENAVHSLEHGAVWLTYDPDAVTGGEIETLGALVEGVPHRMMSPYEGQDTPVSIQSWNHQLQVDDVDDPRLEEFADQYTLNSDHYPEPGATCESPDLLDSPRVA